MSRMLIVRGLPGSGKSTYVRNNYSGIFHLETDMFNMMNGKYVWDIDRSKEAIRLIDFFVNDIFNSPNRPDFCLCGVFSNPKHFIYHIENAKKYGYEVYIKTMTTQYEGIHNVPKEAIEHFKSVFVYDDDLQKILNQKNLHVNFTEMPKLNWMFEG